MDYITFMIYKTMWGKKINIRTASPPNLLSSCFEPLLLKFIHLPSSLLAVPNMRLEGGFLCSLLATTALAQNVTKYAVKTPSLTTDWTYTVGTNPWPEYPRPQLARSDWQSLNGIWTYQNTTSLDGAPPFNQTLQNEVLVPSCLESGLSGSNSILEILTQVNENVRDPRELYALFVVQDFFHDSVFLVWKACSTEFWSCGL